jgi:hypothetical protein
MAEPDDIVPILLRELRADMNRQFEEIRASLREQGKKLDNVRQAAFGESVLARYATAEFEERIERLEKRVEATDSDERLREIEHRLSVIEEERRWRASAAEAAHRRSPSM